MFSANCKCEEKAYHICQLCQIPFCSSCPHKHNFATDSNFVVSICEECEDSASVLYCALCEQHLCEGCDAKIHNKGKRAKHTRNSPYSGIFKAKVLVISLDFHDFLLYNEKAQDTYYLSCRSKVDSSLSPSDTEFLTKFAEMKNIYFVHTSLLPFFEKNAEKVVKLSDALKRKFSFESKSNEEHKISSTNADKSYISDNFDRRNKSFTLYCSNSASFEACEVPIKKQNEKNLSLANSFSRTPNLEASKSFEISKSKTFVFPLVQKVKEIPIKGSLQASLNLQKEFHFWAEKGELLIREEIVLEHFLASFPSEKEAFLEEAVQLGILRKISREFSSENQFVFYSLSLDYLSIMSLKWILLTLKSDFLTPNERLVISRIKECFGLKISAKTWEKILDAINLSQKVFLVSKTNDPFIGTETIVIYLAPKPWIVEDVGKVDGNLWEKLLFFIDKIFERNESIPGGRYGCAQFIKLCGPQPLKEASLGKLNLLVQEAINRNIIRYQRTLLVKSEENNETSLQEEKLSKISQVENAILEILKENSNGVCLAQLPLFLKKKLGCEISFPEIGFPKLKNFLAAMTGKVHVEMMGTNNSFAILKDFINKSRVRNKNISGIEDYLIKVMSVMTAIVKENPFGVKIDILKSIINERLGFDFNPKLFNCPDLCTFLTHFGENLVEIVCRRDELIVYPKDIKQSMRTPPGFHAKKNLGLNPNAKPFEISDNDCTHKKSQSINSALSQPLRASKHTKNIPSLPDSSLSNLNYENPDQFSYDSKQTVRFREESNLDLKENLKFIEELLQENDGDEKSLKTFFEKSDSDNLHTPQLSIGGFGMISAIKGVEDSSQLHSKALSGDFGENFFMANNIKALQHYRFRSNVEGENQFQFY